jgi:tetratricopeptide (TPR) repeat protein
MRKLIAGIVAGCALAFCGHALAQEKLTVWWVKGFYKSEDDALFDAIKKYEAKSGVKVELSQYPVQDMIPKTVAALDRVVQLDPHSIEPYANAAWLLWSSGKYTEAEQYYQRMVEANPDNPEAYYVVGCYFMFRDHPVEALPWLEQAVAHGIAAPKNHLYGHALVKAGRTEQAMAFWQKLLTADPNDEVAKRVLSKLTPVPGTAPVGAK